MDGELKNNNNLSHNQPPFDTQGNLTLDIAISIKLITPFFLFFPSILHYRFYAE